MTHKPRSLAATVAAVALLGLPGCSGDGGSSAEPEPSQEPGGALATLDPCTIMNPQQLQAAGLPNKGVPKQQFEWEPGCSYAGDFATITLYKNQRETVQSYKESGNWGEYDIIKVNDRTGARARVAGSMEDQCSTMISAGGGVVQVAALASDPRKPFDGCAESLKIAQQIEPNLPK